MSRPQFLTSPGCWIRSSSRPTDAVRDACAIERPAALPWKLRELLFVIVVAALGIVGWIASAGGI